MRKVYKKSQLGEIPNNWSINKLGKVAETFAGGTPKRGIEDYYNGSIPWVKSGEVNNRSIDSTEEFISELAVNESSAKLIEPDSILVALYGATAGKVGVLKVRACSNQAVLAVNSKLDNVSNDFLYHYLNNSSIELLNLCQGSGQPNLSKAIVESLQILTPPFPEQQKIAEILSTVDDKIDVIDQQINETQELKKGLMQKLLTKGIGHTEFKDSPLGEIPESWEVARIGDFFEFKNGLNKGKEFFGQGIPIVNYMDVYRNSGLTKEMLKGTVDVDRNEVERFNVKKGDVFFTRTSETIEEIGLSACFVGDIEDAVFSGFVLRARPINERLDLDFKKYCFDSYLTRKEIKSKSTYTTRALTNGTVLSNVNILYPPIQEQQKIAKILSSVDEKLDVLGDKKIQYQYLKKGLMQQLLTGKIRVAV